MEVYNETDSCRFTVLLMYALLISYVALLSQLKAVVVELQHKPRMAFVATKEIETGDELMFDYNDRESRILRLQPGDVLDRHRQRLQSTTSQVTEAESFCSRET